MLVHRTGSLPPCDLEKRSYDSEKDKIYFYTNKLRDVLVQIIVPTTKGIRKRLGHNQFLEIDVLIMFVCPPNLCSAT